MRQFTGEEIQKQFEKLPQSIQEAVTSTDVHDSLIAISRKYGLLIDQEGILVDQVGLVMLGLSPSKDFVKNFRAETGVDEKTATAIAEDINKEIFTQIRSSMRMAEEQLETPALETTKKPSDQVADLERAGNFTMEPTGQGSETVENAEQSVETPSEVIENIERPVPAQPRTTESPENHTDTMLVDHLLSGPVVSVEQKTEQKGPVEPPRPSPLKSPKPSGSDPYREAI